MRITKKDLELKINTLNAQSKGNYKLGVSDGFYWLQVVIDEDSGAVSTVTGADTKKELYYQIRAIQNYIFEEKQVK